MRSEEAAAQTLEAGRRMLRETQQAAQQVERELRDQLTHQASLLAQAQSEGCGARRSDWTTLSVSWAKKRSRTRARARCWPALSRPRARRTRARAAIGPKIRKPKA